MTVETSAPPEGGPPTQPQITLQESGAARDSDKGKKKGLLLADALGVANKHFIGIPESIYGSAMVGPLMFEVDSCEDWLFRCGDSYFRLAINNVIQTLFLIAVWQMTQWQLDIIDENSGQNQECWRITTWFFVICLWIFFATVLTELAETWYLARLVFHYIPTVEGMSQCFRYEEGEGGDLRLCGGGMSMCRKLFVSACILLPKLGIGAGLVVIGGSFLATSTSNSDLLLNALAAVFIIDLDEMIYAFLVPKSTKRLIEEMPPFESDHRMRLVDVLHKFGIYLKVAVSGLMVLVAHQSTTFCDNDPCYGAIRACPVV